MAEKVIEKARGHYEYSRSILVAEEHLKQMQGR